MSNRRRSGFSPFTDATPIGRQVGPIYEPKGHKEIKIDLDQIRSVLKYLRNHQDQPIRSLQGEIQEKFHYLMNNMTLLYDTDHYSALFDEVKRVFGDLDNPTPGTIGGFCGGCINGSPCSPACITSMPQPK